MKGNREVSKPITKEILDKFYFRADGVLLWKEKLNRRIDLDKPAGCIKGRGYWMIGINGKAYQRSRLFWTFMNGDIPKGMEIDHINRDRSDDRIENLRVVTPSENCKNKSCYSNTGYKFIYKHKNLTCKQGFYFLFRVNENGKTKSIKYSIDLKWLVEFRNKWIKTNRPDLYLD